MQQDETKNVYKTTTQIITTMYERNLKACLAFNILGCKKFAAGHNKLAEAMVIFQSTLKGKPPRWSAKEEYSVFRTNIACTIEDNDLLIDIDSWRGLSIAYRLQGKVNAANLCLTDALLLLEKHLLSMHRV